MPREPLDPARTHQAALVRAPVDRESRSSSERMSQDQPAAPALLPRIARGDAEAVRECLARYGPLVWSVARKLWRDVGTLEDLVQEIFVDVWKSAARYDPAQASEATFIATIARRRAIDRRRREQRAAPTESLDAKARDFGADDAALEAVDIGDEAGRARAALTLLGSEQRRVILLSVVEGLTHQEIATSTGMPLGTVKSYIRRGLDKLAQHLRVPLGGGA